MSDILQRRSRCKCAGEHWKSNSELGGNDGKRIYSPIVPGKGAESSIMSFDELLLIYSTMSLDSRTYPESYRSQCFRVSIECGACSIENWCCIYALHKTVLRKMSNAPHLILQMIVRHAGRVHRKLLTWSSIAPAPTSREAVEMGELGSLTNKTSRWFGSLTSL